MINRQKHQTTCGIVAATNALKWHGIDVSYQKMLDHAKRKFGFNHKGVNFKVVLKMVQASGVKTKLDFEPTFKSIEQEIDKGHSVILLYRWSNGEISRGHFVFITGYTDKFFIAWNDSRKNKTPYRSKKILAESMRYSYRWYSHRYPMAIIVESV